MNKLKPAQPTALPEVKDEDRLSAKQLAAQWGMDEDSAYGWRRKGIIPPEYVKFCGPRRFLFHPAVVQFLEEKFAAAHR